MGDSLDGSGEPSPESQNVAIVELPTFASYLRKAVTVLLPDEDAVPPAFNLALEDRYNHECIRKFLGDSQVSSLYVQRSSSKGERDRSIRPLAHSREESPPSSSSAEENRLDRRGPPLLHALTRSLTMRATVHSHVRMYVHVPHYARREEVASPQNQSLVAFTPRALSRQI